MVLCLNLISHQMMGNAEHPIRHDKAGRAFSRPGDRAPPFCNGQRAAEIANSRKENVQTGKKLKLMIPIFERLRKRKSALDCSANLVTVSFAEHQR
jgi:hypothetical protein